MGKHEMRTGSWWRTTLEKRHKADKMILVLVEFLSSKPQL